MTSTIKVDNVQNQPGTNIVNKCGTTTTIGAGAGETINVCAATVNIGRCGGTVALAAGATQTGFGRTGTVDWDTASIKTTGFTAVSGNGYFCNTTSTAFTITLPISPSGGDIIALKDYAATFATNNLTIGRNGSNLDGNAGDKVLAVDNTSLTLVYVDVTQGWKSVEEGAGYIGQLPAFVVATGGTPCAGVTCGDYKVHTFTGPGTLCVSCGGNPGGSDTVDYMIIAGGGSGGGGVPGGPVNHSGAGGAGGYRESPGTASGCYTVSPLGVAPAVALPVTATGYPITVGGGGAGHPSAQGCSGADSTFSTITSAGGGAGGGQNSPAPGVAGGSSGGVGPSGCAGVGNTPPVTPPQGQTGGTPRGGGGGAGGVGGNYPSPAGGGAGVTSSINGTPTPRAGGGGAGGPVSGGGGLGGTGDGQPAPVAQGSPGTVNTGGGAGNNHYGSGCAGFPGKNGGSGLVIIRYKFQ